MKIIFYLSLFTLVSVMSAQMVPYPMSGANGGGTTGGNLPNMIASSGSMAAHGMQPAQSPYPGVYAQNPVNIPAANYLANTNAVNAVASANAVNPKIVASNLEQLIANGPIHANTATSHLAANVATANAVANAVNTANAIVAAENAANNIVNAYENVLAAAEDLKMHNQSPVLNGNMATFYLGNNGNTFTVTSGSPGSQGVGVQIMADALEVGGTVAVNGKIPIYGMVGVNGNIPTDGMASVSYSCANPTNLLYTNL